MNLEEFIKKYRQYIPLDEEYDFEADTYNIISNEGKYIIKENYLSDLLDVINFFVYATDEIATICNEETPDIQIGYQLGDLNCRMSNNRIKLKSIIDNIES